MTNGTKKKQARAVPAENFCATLSANVDNDNMTDAEFRAFVKSTLPIVKFDALVGE
jgi:hypothetical protein